MKKGNKQIIFNKKQCFSLSEKEVEQLDALCFIYSMSKSQLVRSLIRTEFNSALENKLI